ncbi:hypothetical protein AALC16_06315 [Lachnospiraceae bacterium 29-91]
MEETIRLEYGGAGKHFLKSAAGFCALLGMALLLNPVSDGTEEKKPNWQDITELEIAGNKVNAGSREGTDAAIQDAEKLVFRTLLLQERVKKELVLTEKAVPEGCLILPDISDGNMWEAVQPEAPDAAAGAGNAVWVESKERIREELSQGQSGAGNEMRNQTVPKDTDRAGAEAPPVESEEPIGAGVETNPITSGHSSGAGPEADPIKPENPSDAGPEADPIKPENPSDAGPEVEPIVPDGPSDVGPEVEPIVPDGPSDVGPEVEPIVPDGPSDVGTEGEPIVPENPGGDGTDDADQWGPGSAGNDDTAQDNGDEGNKDQGAASCFVLDEMRMLCGFLPEYAEVSDGCLTLPAECTGIRRGAFAGCGAGILELYIPAGAAVIEEGAFSGLVSLEWIGVESGNPGCVSDGGVLFDSTMSVLLAFPAAWMDIYAVPPCVTRIADQAFDGTSIYRLDIRDCTGLSFGQNVFGDSGGNGIQVAVPGSELELYTEMLSGYAVTLTK